MVRHTAMNALVYDERLSYRASRCPCADHAARDAAPPAATAEAVMMRLVKHVLRRGLLWWMPPVSRPRIAFRSIGTGDTVFYLGRGALRVVPGDERGAELVRRSGVFEPWLARLWLRVLAARPPTMVLDVGANYGEMVMVARFPRYCEVVAVEPSPAVADVLARTLRSHRDRSRITAIRAAASDSDGEAFLSADPTWSGTAFVSEEPRPGAVSVPATTIDRLCMGRNLRHLVFKIDVEGCEGRVLAGMAGTLARAASFAGLIEFHSDHMRRAGDDPGEFLRRLGAIAHVQAATATGAPLRLPADGEHLRRCQILVASDRALLARLSIG
jgi:FkbM family methyltransferase